MSLDFSRCRSVWVPGDSDAGGFWSPPLPHVKVGVQQIVEHPHFMLADDMGGAKTAQAIIAAQFLHDLGKIDRVIVVAPASVRPKVWFDQDIGQLREQVWDDKRNTVSEFHNRIRQWSHGPQSAPELRWIVTNYEFIRVEKNLRTLLPYCGPKTLLILDESSAVRTYDAAQTHACMRLRWATNAKGRPLPGVPRCGRVLLLNGTPVAESPLDMFSQMNLLDPTILDCNYVTHFKARYAVQVSVLGYGGKPLTDKWSRPILKVREGPEGWKNIDDLQSRCAPYILRREAKDFGVDFALPPVALEVRLTKETWRYYRQMRDEMVVWLTSGVASARQASIKSIRLAQITSGFLGGVEDTKILDVEALLSGAIPSPEAAEVREVGREKLDFALAWHAEQLRRDPDLKLLTWCRFVPELRRYLSEVARFGHPVGAACGSPVLGESVRVEREHALRLLNPKTTPQGPVTVGATQGTGALGLNFTACHTVLDVSYDFAAWKKKQGDARVNRTGQTRPVSFFYLVAAGPEGQRTIDHHIIMQRLGKTNVNEWTTAAWVRELTEE